MNKLTELKTRIGELMTENESVIANAMLIKNSRSVVMYGNAKRENRTYQNILGEIDKIGSEKDPKMLSTTRLEDIIKSESEVGNG